MNKEKKYFFLFIKCDFMENRFLLLMSRNDKSILEMKIYLGKYYVKTDENVLIIS